MLAILGLLLLVIVASLWGLYCNEKTYRERQAILQKLQYSDRFWQLMEVYELTTYEQHLWATMLFLPRKRLYGGQTDWT
jgi:hypothetical protein